MVMLKTLGLTNFACKEKESTSKLQRRRTLQAGAAWYPTSDYL